MTVTVEIDLSDIDEDDLLEYLGVATCREHFDLVDSDDLEAIQSDYESLEAEFTQYRRANQVLE